jgi:hypothetical protein
MPTNLATLLSGGPAKVTFGGATMLTKNGINADPSLDLFDIEVDTYGVVAQGVSNANIVLPFTPAGVWGDTGSLFRCLRQKVGDFIVPVMPIATVDPVTDQIEVLGHVFESGDSVYIALIIAGGTIPPGLDAATLYYAHKVDADNVTLHGTRADSLTGDNPVDITGAGAGDLALVQEQPLVVHTKRGKRITFHNVGLVEPPTLDPGATRTVFGEARFEVFRRHGKSWADANSLFTIENAAYVDEAFDPVNLAPKVFAASWGATAPWTNMSTELGFRFATGIALTEKGNDEEGILNRQIDRIEPAVRFVPVGIMEEHIWAALRLQGAGTGRGQLTSSGAQVLNLSATGAYIRLYAAQLREGPTRFNRKDYRAGELEFAATQSFTGGVPNPLAFVGNAAPA